jgi:hypothetical protein
MATKARFEERSCISARKIQESKHACHSSGTSSFRKAGGGKEAKGGSSDLFGMVFTPAETLYKPNQKRDSSF